MSESQKEKENIGEQTKQKIEDDEPDEWDKRIFSTGCSAEQTKMNDCYFEKKDWRACAEEMQAFRACWKINGNDQRTATKDA